MALDDFNDFRARVKAVANRPIPRRDEGGEIVAQEYDEEAAYLRFLLELDDHDGAHDRAELSDDEEAASDGDTSDDAGDDNGAAVPALAHPRREAAIAACADIQQLL